MTGGQDSVVDYGKIDIICEAIGVEKEHIRILKPLHRVHKEKVESSKEETIANQLAHYS